LIKNITPDFNLSIIWSNEKLSKLYSPRLKLGVPLLQKAGTVYQFTCECGSEYVGESRRALRKRIMEHHQLKKQSPSPIYKHIYMDKCIAYSFNLTQHFGSLPSKSQEISFFEQHFKLIESNLTNYVTRTDLEAMVITLRHPDLNDQIYHKNITLI